MKDKIVAILILVLFVTGSYYGYRHFFHPGNVIADGLPGGATYEFDPANFGKPVVVPNPSWHAADPHMEPSHTVYGITAGPGREINTLSFQLTVYKDGKFNQDVRCYYRRAPGGTFDLRQEMNNRQFIKGQTFKERLRHLKWLDVSNYEKGYSWGGENLGRLKKFPHSKVRFDERLDYIILSRWDGEGEIVHFVDKQSGFFAVYHDIQINPDLPDEMFLPPVFNN